MFSSTYRQVEIGTSGLLHFSPSFIRTLQFKFKGPLAASQCTAAPMWTTLQLHRPTKFTVRLAVALNRYSIKKTQTCIEVSLVMSGTGRAAAVTNPPAPQRHTSAAGTLDMTESLEETQLAGRSFFFMVLMLIYFFFIKHRQVLQTAIETIYSESFISRCFISR